MKAKFESFLVDKNSSIKETMMAIDKAGVGVAFITDGKKKLWGVVTDGDVRRAILRGISIEKSIQEIANKDPIFFNDFGGWKNQEKKVREEIEKRKISILTGSFKIPVIDKDRKIKDIVFLSVDEKNSFHSSKKKSKFVQGAIKKVLIIGGAGYLGSVLCRKLLNKGYKIRVLDNLTYGDDGIRELYQNKNFEFLKGDIRNISQIIEAIKGIDAVIHLAAIVGDSACQINPQRTIEINYLSTKTIAEICKFNQINKFLFASTCSVYGASSVPDEKLTEESFLNPVSLYAETKIKCENGILEVLDENFSPTILRMATLYGYSPNMRFDLAVNFLTAQAIFDKKIIIFGGGQWRPWLHVDDAAEAYIKCLEAPIEKVRGKVFNVLSENYKVIEIGKIIKSIFPKTKIEISKKITDKRNYNVSFDKISQVLNYRPRKKITDGISEIKDITEKGLITNYLDPKYRASLPQI